jgi:transcription antitermination factor NusG
MERVYRFKTGDRVRVQENDPSPFAGLEGVVEGIEPHPRDVAVLDRYIVTFEWGERKLFYDAQLVKIG